MSDSEKNEPDSTNTTAEEAKEEEKEETSASLETVVKVENSENGLSAKLEEKIIRQVEYYFGDRNLPRDKFLQSAISESDGGWVPIETLLTFNRLKALSSDSTYIINALRKNVGNVLEINSEGTSVRRSPDNPPPDIFSPLQRQTMREKTVYVKGFDENLALDDVQSFFDQYGKIEHVQMRRNLIEDRKFKGSVFAEFRKKEMAESFLKLPTITFKGTELLKESKDAYHARKAEERKVKKELKQITAKSTLPSKVKIKNAVMFFKGSMPNISRENIKEVVQEFASVIFIDYQKGDAEGYVRFGEEGGALRCVDGMKEAATDGGNTLLCGAEVELKVLEGDEEETYWAMALDHKSKSKRGGRGGGRGGRRGRGGHHGYQGDKNRRQRSFVDAPAFKKQKLEEGEDCKQEMEGDDKQEVKDMERDDKQEVKDVEGDGKLEVKEPDKQEVPANAEE